MGINIEASGRRSAGATIRVQKNQQGIKNASGKGSVNPRQKQGLRVVETGRGAFSPVMARSKIKRVSIKGTGNQSGEYGETHLRGPTGPEKSETGEEFQQDDGRKPAWEKKKGVHPLLHHGRRRIALRLVTLLEKKLREKPPGRGGEDHRKKPIEDLAKGRPRQRFPTGGQAGLAWVESGKKHSKTGEMIGENAKR